MCGQFTRLTDLTTIAQRFGVPTVTVASAMGSPPQHRPRTLPLFACILSRL